MRRLFQIFRSILLQITITAVFLLIGLFILFIARSKFEFVKKLAPMKEIRYWSLQEVYRSDPVFAVRRKPWSSYDVELAPHLKQHPILGKNFNPVRVIGNHDKEGFRIGTTLPGPVDIVIHGDSFMECGDTDGDTFSEHLKRISGKTTANYGISNWGPPQSLRAFQEFGKKRKPKIVLFSFFEGNDIDDIRAFQTWLNGGQYYDYPNLNQPLSVRFSRFLREIRDYSLKQFKNHVRIPIAKWRGRYIDGARHVGTHFKIQDREFWDIVAWFGDNRPYQEQLQMSEWNELKRILLEFQREAKEIGAQFVIMYIPTKGNIFAPYSTKKSGPTWQTRRKKILAGRHNTELAMRSILKNTGIPLISLTKLFEKHAPDEPYIFWHFDGHWSSYGRQISARYVAQELERLFPSLDFSEE